MTLIKALKEGHTVLIQFIDVKKNAQWGITFNKPTELAHFLTPMVGEVQFVGEPEPERPFDYYKAIFVTEDPPEKEEEEDLWDDDIPCGYA